MESMYLTARETAERLGIKRDTLYAYVSRGLLRSQPIPGSRERGYRTEEVERLRAGRGLSRATRGEPFVPVIASAICLIEGGRLYYRGHDAIRLAETTTLEDIAGLLWGQDPISTFRHSQRSEARGIGGRVGAAASLGVIERCHVRLAELAAADLGALDLTPHGIVRTGRAILYELAVMAARLARNEMLPGLGHPLYPAGDPRAAALLNAAMAAIPASRPLIEAAVAAARQLVPQPPNVDFALAAATTALGLPQGTALAIFILGRTVGWIAHAIEQYQSDVLIRPRARYTGPRPGEENPA